MKILVVASGNAGVISPFITDQVNSINLVSDIQTDYFLVKGQGIWGYLKNLLPLIKKIRINDPDLIHAHCGIVGLLCILQRQVPVITTFHGSDINDPKLKILSKLVIYFCHQPIFVSHQLAQLVQQKNAIILPCGVDTDIFYPINKSVARKKMNLSEEKKYILFSSSFSRKVKNHELAIEAVKRLNQSNTELIELKGYTRKEVALLMNAVDLALLTSFTEGSPQFIKEALACNCPIVSTNVGDVSALVSRIDGCYLSSFEHEDVTNKIKKAFQVDRLAGGAKRIHFFDNKIIAKKLIDVYHRVLDSS